MQDYNKPIWQLTIGELVDLLDSRNSKIEDKCSTEVGVKKNYAYGLSGLAKILGCSKNHAGKLKSKGIFDEAIIQNGRKIIIDTDKALELFRNSDK